MKHQVYLTLFLFLNACLCDYDALCKTEKLNDNFTNWMKCHMAPWGWFKFIRKCHELRIFMEHNYDQLSQLDKFDLEDLLPDLEYLVLIGKILETPNHANNATIKEFSDYMNANMTETTWKKLIFWIMDYDMAMLQSQNLEQSFGDQKPSVVLNESDPFTGPEPFKKYDWPYEKYTFEEMLLDFIAK